VADEALPQAARAVDVLVAVGVGDDGAAPRRDDERLERAADDLVGVDDVGPVEPGEPLVALVPTAVLIVFTAVYSPIDSGPSS
jgi:hypothetical protein